MLLLQSKKLIIWTIITVLLSAYTKNNQLDIEADHINIDAQNNKKIIAEGNVLIKVDNRTLTADKISYYTSENKIIAQGNVKIIQKNDFTIYSQETELSGDLKKGVIKLFTLKLNDNSIIKGKHALKHDNGKLIIYDGMYTPCPINCNNKYPLWSINAKQATVDREQIKYKNVKLNIYNSTIFYTPYFKHRMPGTKRKTGLMAPVFINNTYIGQSIKIPYYIDINDKKNLILAPLLTTKRGIIFTTEYNHKTDNGKYNINFSATSDKNKHDPNEKTGKIINNIRGHIYADGQFNVAKNWQLNFDLNFVNDKTYIKNYGFRKHEFDLDILTSKIAYNKYTDKSHYKLELVAFQNLRNSGDLTNTPYALPFYRTHHEFDVGKKHKALIDLNMLSLQRTHGMSINRISTKATLLTPLTNNLGHMFKLFTSVRGDIFKYNNLPNTNNLAKDKKIVSRLIPELRAEWSWPLLVNLKNRQFIVEPISTLTLSQNTDSNKNIYNEDSQYVELSDNNILAPNRYTGIDLIENGSRFDYGLRSHFYNTSGNEINILLAQSYSRNKYNLASSFGKKLGDHFSDIVGRISLANIKNFNILYRFAMDKKNLKIKRQSLNLNKTINYFNFSIDYISIYSDNLYNDRNIKARREILFRTSLNNYKNWTLFAGARFNLDSKYVNNPLINREKKLITIENSIIKKTDCVDYSFMFKRDYTKAEGKKPANTFLFKLSLKNIF